MRKLLICEITTTAITRHARPAQEKMMEDTNNQNEYWYGRAKENVKEAEENKAKLKKLSLANYKKMLKEQGKTEETTP